MLPGIHSQLTGDIKNVNVSIIQEALGHETELQTMTYLDDLDDSIIANSIRNAL